MKLTNITFRDAELRQILLRQPRHRARQDPPYGAALDQLRSSAAFVILSIITIAAPLTAADTPLICGTGVLRDVETITETVATRQETRVRITKTRKGDIVERIESSPAERREKTYHVTVDVDGMVYTGRSTGDNPWNFNPTRLVIDDAIGVCVDGSRLILKRPDGKNYKLQIVRVVRTVKDGR